MVRDNSVRYKKGQVSIEYLIIFGVAFMMTLPLIVIYARQTTNVQADVTRAQTFKVASKISDYAEQVYYMGEPAQRTLTISFPEGINNVIVQGNAIIFNITTSDLTYTVEQDTVANLTGSIRPFAGPHSIVFTASQDYVNITDH